MSPEPKNELVLYSGKANTSRTDEIYIAKSNGLVTDRIACDQDGSVPNPGCNHYSHLGDLTIKLNYRKTNLDRWEEMRTHVHEAITCFIQEAKKIQLNELALWRYDFNRVRPHS